MTTLDKYIIKKYLGTFFYAVLIFTMIIMVIDFSEKIDDYIEEGLSAKTVIFDYYVNYLPHLNSLLFPLYALITVVFFTSRMAYNSEIIAILGGGVSFNRIARPYMVAAAVVFLIHFVGSHVLIPLGGKKQVAFENAYIYKQDVDSKTRNIHLFLDSTSKIYIRNYSLYDSTAREVTLERFSNGKLIGKMAARRAEYNEESGKWTFFNYHARDFSGMKETLRSGPKIDSLINLAPADLHRRDNLRYTMTSFELNEFIESEKSRGMGGYRLHEVELHRRTSEPFTIFILTLIGLAIASRKVRGGIGLHLAMGVGIGSLYIALTKFSTTFSTNGNLSPFMGVWIPNIIYIFITIWIFRRAQK